MAVQPPDPDHVARFRADLEALTGGAPDSLGLAVSGGPDSVALLLLGAAALPGAVKAATVDHGLRPEAADEARFVAGLCGSLAVPHRTLAGALPRGGGPQARARALRYRLLGGWAEEEALGWIATAHHLDDQAETLLMRLNRGAGAGGLAAIRRSRPLAGATLVRPLLGWRRDELAAIVAAAGIEAADDPSNRAPEHDRTRVRALLAAEALLDPRRLAASADHLAEAEQALAWAADRAWGERARQTGDAVEIDSSGLPRELRRRLLVQAIEAVRESAGIAGRWRVDGASALLDALDSGGCGTLAGVAARSGRCWRLAPAPPRRS